MPYFINNNVFFIHIPRSGGSYIENIIKCQNERIIFLSPYQYFNGTSPQHQPYEILCKLNIISNDMRIFTIIRPNIERFVSEFNWLIKIKRVEIKCTFDSFLDSFLDDSDEARYRYDNHNMPNEWFLNNNNHRVKIFEFQEIFNLEYDKSELKQYLNIADIPKDIFKNDSINDNNFAAINCSDEQLARIDDYVQKIIIKNNLQAIINNQIEKL